MFTQEEIQILISALSRPINPLEPGAVEFTAKVQALANKIANIRPERTQPIAGNFDFTENNTEGS